jgi:hypothetical protein
MENRILAPHHIGAAIRQGHRFEGGIVHGDALLQAGLKVEAAMA